MKFYKQPDVYTEFLNVLNIIFTVFFTLEFVFKLGAFRFKVRFWIYTFAESLNQTYILVPHIDSPYVDQIYTYLELFRRSVEQL